MRRRIYLLALVVVAGAFFAIRPVEPREPVYAGKKLSAWLVEGWGSEIRRIHAHEALRHIGTNALPFLIEWSKYEPSGLRIKCYSLLDRLPVGLRQTALVKSLRVDRLSIKSQAAADGFYLMGWDAKPAIPHLCWLLTPHGKRVSENFWIAEAWFEIYGFNSDTAVRSLAAIVNDRSNPNRLGATIVVQLVGYYRGGLHASDCNAAIIPALLNAVKDPVLSGQATASLMVIQGIDKEMVITNMAGNLRGGSAVVRCASVRAIGNFEGAARPDAWRLLQTLADDDPQVRRETTNALIKIMHPEEAWKMR